MIKLTIAVLSLLGAPLAAQTLSIGAISPLTYCIGDTMVVPYSASGAFAADNFFALQLSDSNGSFATFVNFGHDTAMSGSFRVPMLAKESRRRLRLASTDPYLVSVDNGNDYSALPLPAPSIQIRREATRRVYASGGFIGFAGEQFSIFDAAKELPGTTYLWQFDSASGLTPTTDSLAHITFPTEGITRVTLRVSNANGCISNTAASFNVLSCSPEIPASAHIVTGTEDTWTAGQKNIVVKTGGNLTGYTKWQTIYAEPGSSVALSAMSGGFVYLKPGASFSCQGGGDGADGHLPIIVITPERQIVVDNSQFNYDTLYCSDMSFGTSLLSGGQPNGQTLTVGQIPTYSYRVGDTVTVPYQASGSFGDGNFFALQLSGADGSFNSFTTVAKDTASSGRLAFRMAAMGNHFRVRVASSDPYLASPDNGKDITTLASGVFEATLPGVDIRQISDRLVIQSVEPILAIHVYSLLGTELLSQRGSSTLDIDLSHIPAGIYFAVVEAGERREVRKIGVVH